MKKARRLLSGLTYFAVLTAWVFILLPKTVFAADIVINEVFANPVDENTEFIELFNKGSQDIVLTNWKIADKVKSFVIPDITLQPHSFYVLDKSVTGISLNNSGGEDVTLKDQSDQLIDSFTYDATIEERSWSRHPDGAGGFFTDINPTKGSENSGPPPSPTATPTLTPIPTKTPTPMNTPTPTKTPTSTPTPTASPTGKSTPTLSPTITPRASATGKPLPTNILGISTKSALLRSPSITPTKRPTPTVKVQGAQTNQDFVPFFFIGGGILLLISCGILTFQPQLKKIWKRD